MPNWCQNKITIKHDDPKMIIRIKDNTHRFIEEFIPTPENEDWYDWRLDNWGVKWDVELIITSITDNEICASFKSAWYPPVEAYKALTEMGFEIEAYFYEEGCQITGTFEDGIFKMFKIDFEDKNWREGGTEKLVQYLNPYYEDFLEYLEYCKSLRDRPQTPIATIETGNEW